MRNYIAFVILLILVQLTSLTVAVQGPNDMLPRRVCTGAVGKDTRRRDGHLPAYLRPVARVWLLRPFACGRLRLWRCHAVRRFFPTLCRRLAPGSRSAHRQQASVLWSGRTLVEGEQQPFCAHAQSLFDVWLLFPYAADRDTRLARGGGFVFVGGITHGKHFPRPRAARAGAGESRTHGAQLLRRRLSLPVVAGNFRSICRVLPPPR